MTHNERFAPARVSTLFRYRKADRTRAYELRLFDDHSGELWVKTSGGGQEPRTRRLMTLANESDTRIVLESVEQELRTVGWVEV